MALGTRQRDLSPMFDALADDNVRQYTQMNSNGSSSSSSAAQSDSKYSMSSPSSSTTGEDGLPMIGLQHSSSIIPLEGGALQSPQMAFKTPYFKFNVAFSIIFNIGLNVGLGYWGMSGMDTVGLWDSPQPLTLEASSTKMALDLTLTCFFVVFFTSLLATGGIKGEIKKGKLAPVPDHTLCAGLYKYWLPIRMHGLWSKSFALGFFYIIIWLAPWLALLGIACQAGGMHGEGDDAVCQMNAKGYIWFKGFWAGATAGVAYPALFVAALNRDLLADEIYDAYMEKFNEAKDEIGVSDSVQ